MPEVNLSPYQADYESIQRRRKMAELLSQKADEALPTNQMAGGYVVPVSPFAGLAQVLNQHTAGRQEEKLNKEQKDLFERYQGDSKSDMMSLAKALSAPAQAAQAANADVMQSNQSMDSFDPTAATPARIAGQIDPEMLAQMKTGAGSQAAMAQILAQLVPKAPIKASAGDVFFNAQGKELFRAPEKSEFGTTPHYETIGGKSYAVYSDKQGNRKMVEATPMNQFTTGTVDAAQKRDMDMYQFGNLSAEQRAALGIKLTQAGVDVAKLNWETGQAPTPQPGLPANAPAPNFGGQMPPRPQAGAGQDFVRLAQAELQNLQKTGGGTPQADAQAVQLVQALNQRGVNVPVGGGVQPGLTPKAQAEIAATRAGEAAKQANNGAAVLKLAEGAEALIDKAHGSGVGSAIGWAQNMVGIDSSKNNADAQLKALEGALVSKQPRMEGPQSDRDVMLYRQMAGMIGDSTVTGAQRKAALKTVREIAQTYINGFSATGYQPVGNSASGKISTPGLDDALAKYK